MTSLHRKHAYDPPCLTAAAYSRPRAQAAIAALLRRGKLSDRQLMAMEAHCAGKTASEIAELCGKSPSVNAIRWARRYRNHAFALVITEIRKQKQAEAKTRAA
jgi:hypothetical protein